MTQQTPNNNSRPRRFANIPENTFGEDVTLQHEPITRPTQVFRPLPAPTGPAPYHLSLSSVLPAEQIAAITASGKLIFHTVGDTGGVKSPQPQQIVMSHMDHEFDDPNPQNRPVFFYNLGDVVYYYGEASQYYSQFYDPAVHY